LKQKKNPLKLIENILEMCIASNLVFCTKMSDCPYINNTSDLADRLTNIVLKIVSEDTLIFICMLNILQIEKVRNRK